MTQRHYAPRTGGGWVGATSPETGALWIVAS